MIKPGAAFWLVLVLASGFATFKVKYTVQDIDDQLTRVRRQTIAEQQEIRVLTAEWTYLNQPERLAEMNRRFLQFAPLTPKQLQQKIADIPLRPPEATPDVVVAANSSPAPPATQAPNRPQPTQATYAPPALSAALPVRVAAAEPAAMPASLDALIAQIEQQ